MVRTLIGWAGAVSTWTTALLLVPPALLTAVQVKALSSIYFPPED